MHSLLAKAIALTIESTLRSSSDGIVRLVPPRDWPVGEAIKLLAEKLSVRVLLQKPFHNLSLAVPSSSDPGQATAWRNEVNREFSVLVLGYPGANLDAGLHDIRRVSNSDITERWKGFVLELLQSQGDLGRPVVTDLIGVLFGALGERRLGVRSFTTYLEAIKSGGTFADVTASMWQLSVFVDSQILDSGVARQRLERNISLVERLREGEEKLVQKLRNATSAMESASLAEGVLRFLDSSDPTHLQSIELSDIEKLLFGAGTAPPSPSPKVLGIFELLDKSVEDLDEVRKAVIELQEDFKSFKETPNETTTRAFEIAGERIDVNVSLTFRDLQTDNLDNIFKIDSDPVVTAEHVGPQLPHHLSEANGRKLSLASWLERVNPHATTDEFVILRRRLHFLQYVPAVEDVFTILFLIPSIREDVLQYCQSWQSMVGEIMSSSGPGTRSALLSLQALEVLVDAQEDPTWLGLSLIHPFRLEPLARVAEYCEATLLADGPPSILLGDAAKWMLDRSIPAYPAFYREQSVFHLAVQSPLLVYRAHSRTVLPTFTDARGLERVTQSIVAYSPWMKHGASLLLIDPPPGKGVTDALRSLKAQLGASGNLLVYHGQRRGTTSNGLADFDGDVVYLGSEWEEDATLLPLTDVALVFSPESETSHMSTAETWAAAPGTHMVLNLSVSGSDDLFDVEVRPRIDVKPSSENGIVNAIQSLYEGLSGGRAPHAAIAPADTDPEQRLFDTLQKRTDWIVTARPGPFGLVNAGHSLHSLGYVGRTTSGRYLISAFGGSEVYGVRRFIEAVLRDTPVATIEPDDMANRLVELAQRSAHSLLAAARQPIPSLGELIGLDIASTVNANEQISVSLAMDDLGWTRAWLGQNRRPDFVVVRFDLVSRSVVVRIVECKTNSSSEQSPLRSTEPHIREALDQVQAATIVLQRLFSGGYSLAEDLQFSSFIEHLFAVLLNSTSLSTDRGRDLLTLANNVAERKIEPTFEQWIFLSQPTVNAARVSSFIEGARVYWLGAPEVNRLLRVADVGEESPLRTNQPIQMAASQSAILRRPDSTPSSLDTEADSDMPPNGATIDQEKPGSSDLHATHSPRVNLEKPDTVSEQDQDGDEQPRSSSSSAPSPESEMLAREFISAMQRHNAEVVRVTPSFVRVGPSLVGFGVQLLEGTSLQPIRARLGDIAREVGLGNREHELWIENSSEPGVIQVLVPRPDRSFPRLPRSMLGAVHDDAYIPLYLGQTIFGSDFASAVEKWPHMLIAGTTGSGKTTLLRTILTQLTRTGPENLTVVVADGKGDTDYLGIVPEMYFPKDLVGVQLGADRAMDSAEWAVEELERRSALIHKIVAAYVGMGSVPKAADVFKSAMIRGEVPPIAPLILIIDEFADIMLSSNKKYADAFMTNIQRLAQVGRSRLMHVLLATQRPDRNTIRGAVRANFDARIALRLPTAADSMTILGTGGAEKLMAHGDMLFRASSGQVTRLQGYSLD